MACKGQAEERFLTFVCVMWNAATCRYKHSEFTMETSWFVDIFIIYGDTIIKYRVSNKTCPTFFVSVKPNLNFRISNALIK